MSGFGWTILGTGAVSRKFALDVKAAGMSLASVASRDRGKAQAFARSLGVDAALSYEEAVHKGDAVYVATPAALHEEHALLAIAAGKPVLVEKPFAHDAASAQRIADAAKAAGVFCMEAMWTRFQPLPVSIRGQVPKLGQPTGFEARFLAANVPDPGVSLFDPNRAGGALLHRGIYPISMALYWLGPVTEVQAMLRRGETGVDEEAVLLMRHDNGALSTIRASLRANGPDGASLMGTEASLDIEGPIWRPTGAVLHQTKPSPVTQGGARKLEAFRESTLGLRLSGALARLRKAKGQRIKAPFAGNGYRYEAEALRDAVAAGQTQSDLMPMVESIAVLQIIETALRQMENAT